MRDGTPADSKQPECGTSCDCQSSPADWQSPAVTKCAAAASGEYSPKALQWCAAYFSAEQYRVFCLADGDVRIETMRVLVVEDEPELLRVIARALREEAYAVDEAADGQEALFKATTWTYDAIVLDLMLPRLSGFEVLDRLRQQKTTPVLILTARDAIDDRVHGLDAGADDYLIKPFDLSELFARLRALVRRAKGKATATITIGSLVVDTRNRTVTLATRLVPLTAREYGLVELLALKRGEIVTRTEIYDHLFDENSDTLSNLVEVHIANIRRKLGRELIQTRRGLGYIIDG